jgi:hypothetical protein
VFEGYICNIHVKRTAQASALYSGHARVIILLDQVIDPVSMLGLLIDVQPALS